MSYQIISKVHGDIEVDEVQFARIRKPTELLYIPIRITIWHHRIKGCTLKNNGDKNEQ